MMIFLYVKKIKSLTKILKLKVSKKVPGHSWNLKESQKHESGQCREKSPTYPTGFFSWSNNAYLALSVAIAAGTRP